MIGLLLHVDLSPRCPVATDFERDERSLPPLVEVLVKPLTIFGYAHSE